MGFPATANIAPQFAPPTASPPARRLRYRFSPAAQPEKSPLLILFHGWSGQPYDFSHPDWNVLAPWDCFGVGRNGCWWLGEQGDYFMLGLLDNMVETVIREYKLPRQIYCWGTSMGGFGALLHGLRWKVKAICANVPQVRILHSDYHQQNTSLVDGVFGPDRESPLADVTNLLDVKNPANNPLIFLVQSRFDMYERYTGEQCFHLVDALNRHGVNYFLTIAPVKGHMILAPPEQALRLFTQYASVIDAPIVF